MIWVQTPRWWSGLIQSLALFLLLLSCCKYSVFPRKKVQFFTVQVSHSYQKGVAFVGMRHLFGCFSIKKLLFLWYFTKWWLCSIWVILGCICRMEVSPFCRRTAFFCLEDSVKMSATRESPTFSVIFPEISCWYENKTVTLRKSHYKDRLGIMVETNDRRLPVGIQSFEKIRKDGYLYVDKTDIIWQLANRNKTYN